MDVRDDAKRAPPARGRGSLVRKFALWMSISAGASFLAFAAVAYGITVLQETDEGDGDSPARIASEARAEVLGAMAIAAPIGLVLAAGGAILFSRRALRPLGDVVRSATAMTARELDRRLPVPRENDEVRETVLALNALFDRLEAGFGALGRFAGEASHELRTPLAVVAAELEVMLRSPRKAGEWEASARTCLDEVRHLARLVEALLEMSRAERAPKTPTEAADVRSVIDRVIGALAPRALERGVRLRGPDGANDEDARSAMDPDALESALRNVVDNAVRYTPSGGEVGVSWGRDQERILVCVDDSGGGVDPPDAQRIFEPFARGEAGRASDEGEPVRGAGLGLTIARRVLESQGAHIEVSASVQGGARFRISLPVFRNS